MGITETAETGTAFGPGGVRALRPLRCGAGARGGSPAGPALSPQGPPEARRAGPRRRPSWEWRGRLTRVYVVYDGARVSELAAGYADAALAEARGGISCQTCNGGLLLELARP
jgi:hypothetical protein